MTAGECILMVIWVLVVAFQRSGGSLCTCGASPTREQQLAEYSASLHSWTPDPWTPREWSDEEIRDMRRAGKKRRLREYERDAHLYVRSIGFRPVDDQFAIPPRVKG